VTVSDPIHIQDGMGKYTAYHISVVADPQQQQQQQQAPEMMMMMQEPTAAGNHNHSPMNYFSSSSGGGAVLRRYSDFVWLLERFRAERGGAIVPPLPEKQSVNRFNAMFVAQRAAQLQVFLNDVYVHPELYDSECLQTFLRADEGSFMLAKKQSELSGESKASALLASASNPISKWFNGNGAAANGVPRQQTQDDLIMAQVAADLKEWELQIKSVLTHSQKLVKKSKEVANGYFEMGLAFTSLGQSESDVLGRALTRVGQSSDKVSIITAEHSEKEFANYEAPLSHYLKVISSARDAVKCRNEAKESYYSKMAQVQQHQLGMEKNRNRPGREEKYYHHSNVFQKSQQESEIALNNCNAVNQRVLREMDRFKRETEVKMKKIIREYVALQVDYYSKMENIWGMLVTSLEEETAKDVEVITVAQN